MLIFWRLNDMAAHNDEFRSSAAAASGKERLRDSRFDIAHAVTLLVSGQRGRLPTGELTV